MNSNCGRCPASLHLFRAVTGALKSLASTEGCQDVAICSVVVREATCRETGWTEVMAR